MAKKYSKDVKIELRERRVKHKSIEDETVLENYWVTAPDSSGVKHNIGYCETGTNNRFAPIAQAGFPPELFPVVEMQIAQIKASWINESAARTSSVAKDPGKDG